MSCSHGALCRTTHVKLLTPRCGRGAKLKYESQAGKPDLRVWDLSGVMQGLKGFTAYRINEVLNTRGHAFWQDESYDRLARDEDEVMRIILYDKLKK